MKKSLFWMLSALAVSGLFTLAACDEDESGDPTCATANPCAEANANRCYINAEGVPACAGWDCENGYKSDGSCNDSALGAEGSPCSDSQQCAGELSCYKGFCSSAAQVEDYKFIRIDDMSAKCPVDKDGKCSNGKDDPGVDIDAIALIKSDQTPVYATAVKGYARADGVDASAKADNTMAVNPEKAIGKPDAFIHYPGDRDGVCYYYPQGVNAKDNENAERTFVSLGGQGGYLIVEMPDSIENGDKIDILEIGDCTLYNTKSKPSEEAGKASGAEDVSVQLSISGDITKSDWKQIGTTKHATNGIITFDVAGL